MRDIADEVCINTGSGRIELEFVSGTVHAEAGSGSIEASGVTGRFSAETGGGNIQGELVDVASVDVSSRSGDT